MTTLTAQERDILADYANAWEIRDIAEVRGLRLDRVQGIIAIKAGMSRARALDLVNGGAQIVDESPLTAPIVKATGSNGAKPAAKAKTTTRPTPAAPAPAPQPSPVDAASQPEPEPEPTPAPTVDPIQRMLDDGIDALTLRLRALVASLVDTAVEQRVARIRGRLEQLQAELDGGAP